MIRNILSIKGMNFIVFIRHILQCVYIYIYIYAMNYCITLHADVFNIISNKLNTPKILCPDFLQFKIEKRG